MKKADIIIFYEHVARELDVFSNVKTRLEQSLGCKIEIVSQKYDRVNVLKTFKEPKLVCFPSLFLNKGKIYDVVDHWKNAAYVSFNFEQFFRNVELPGRLPRGNFVLNKVQHLAWGEFFTEFLVSAGVDSNNVHKVGNPVYNLYQPPFSEYYDNRSVLAQKYGLDPNKKWVFIPENYTAAFYTKQRIEGFIARGIDKAELMQNVKFSTESLKTAIDWWKTCAEQENIELIIRPKPVNPPELFVALLSENGGLKSNLHIIKEGSCREWVLASDVTVSSYSTVLIEAAIAGKSCLMTQSSEPNESIKSDWHSHVPVVATKDDFLQHIEAVDSDRPNNQKLVEWIEQNLYDSGESIGKICDVIADVYRRTKEAPSGVSLREELDSTIYRFLNKARQLRANMTPGKTLRQNTIECLGHKVTYNFDFIDKLSKRELDMVVNSWARFSD